MQNVELTTSNKTTEETEDDQTATAEERETGSLTKPGKLVPTTQTGKSMEDAAQDTATSKDGKSMDDMAQVTETSKDTSTDVT